MGRLGKTKVSESPMSLPESQPSNVTPVGACKPTKKNTVWSEAMTVGEPKKNNAYPKKGTPWFLLVGETWVTKTANSFSKKYLPPLKRCPKIRCAKDRDFLSCRIIIPQINHMTNFWILIPWLQVVFCPKKTAPKSTIHTLHLWFLSKQPNIRSEKKNTPILQPCWCSCSSNVKRKCSICNVYRSLFLHQIMDQSALQQIIIFHHISWTAMSFSQQSQPGFLLSHQPGETIYIYIYTVCTGAAIQRSTSTQLHSRGSRARAVAFGKARAFWTD